MDEHFPAALELITTIQLIQYGETDAVHSSAKLEQQKDFMCCVHHTIRDTFKGSKSRVKNSIY